MHRQMVLFQGRMVATYPGAAALAQGERIFLTVLSIAPQACYVPASGHFADRYGGYLQWVARITMHLFKGRVAASLLASTLVHALLFSLPELGRREPGSVPAAKSATLTVSIARPVTKPQTAGERQAGRSDAQATKPATADTKFSTTPQPEPGKDHAEHQQQSDGADLLPTPARIYYGSEELTRRPQPAKSVNLDPPSVQDIVATGRLVMLIWINEHGTVDDAALEYSDLPSSFGDAALAAIKDARFIPGELNGLPVSSKLKIEVNYDDGRGLNRR